MTTIRNRARTLIIAFLVGVIALGAGIAVAHNDGTEIRITAMRHDDGRVEFAVQEREGEGWGERVLPRARFFPTTSEGRWLNSTPITVGLAPGSGPRPRLVVLSAVAELEPDEAPGFPAPGIIVVFYVQSTIAAREYAYSIDIRESGWLNVYVPARGYESFTIANEGIVSSWVISRHHIGFGSMGTYYLDYGSSYDIRVCIRYSEDDICEEVHNVVTPLMPARG